ncbi:DUF3341 domain-containing protein [Compostibacter hankyongensis]|uniref:DUF3341 domain-containing protein n=1 Tax=Compostibacter hankyongensis TaxID=1007089 RepID=A0ABP8FDV3_9BACT
MIKNFVVGCFKEEADTFKAVEQVRATGYKLHDVYTPFPIHGLDEAMGLRGTSLHTAGFLYGLLGTLTALLGMSYVTVMSWPLNFDGKPHFPLPAFIPITFELTVLFSSVGMVLTFCWLNQIMPGVKKHIFHPRQTDDYMVMVIEVTPKTRPDEVVKMLEGLNAVEITQQRAEAGWWFGKFSKREKYEEAGLSSVPVG